LVAGQSNVVDPHRLLLKYFTEEWEERTIYGKRIRIPGASKCSKRLLGL
jgi:hypothetical protein